MEQGQQSLEEDVHHAPGAMNIVSEAMCRGNGSQVRPVPDRGGSFPFFIGAWAGKSGIGCSFFSQSAAGPSHNQQRWRQRRYHPIGISTYNVMRSSHFIVLICSFCAIEIVQLSTLILVVRSINIALFFATSSDLW